MEKKKILSWLYFFVISGFLFLLVMIMSNVVFYTIWAGLSLFLLARLLWNTIEVKEIRIYIAVFLSFMFVVIGFEMSVKKNELAGIEYGIVVGDYIGKEDNCLVYQYRKSRRTLESVHVKVDPSLYDNETPFFDSIRETALITTNGHIICWSPNEEQKAKYINPVIEQSCGNYGFELGNQNYYYARTNPARYIDQFGISVVYPAEVTDLCGERECIVSYVDMYCQPRTVQLKNYIGKNKLSKGSRCFIEGRVTEVYKSGSVFSLVPNEQELGVFGLAFADTLIAAQDVFREIPVFKSYLMCPGKCPTAPQKIVIGYYLQTKTVPSGRSNMHEIEFMYYDENNDIQIVDCMSPDRLYYLQFADKEVTNCSPVLISVYDKKIIKEELSESDYKKYKYPVILEQNNEIGNSSYPYAKAEPLNFNNRFLKLAYLADVDSYTERLLVDETDIHFRDTSGILRNAKTSVWKSWSRPEKLIVFNKSDCWIAASLEFQTEEYYSKFNDGYAFIFKDTILTKKELVRNIPAFERYLMNRYPNLE